MSGLQIDAGQVGFRKIDAAEVGLVSGFSARFHPLFVLIQNLGEIDERNSDRAFSAGSFRNGRRFFFRLRIDCDFGLQLFNFFDCVDIRSHANSFPD